jgi:uncharacterized Fe-S cluster-containing radical SAM superfamily enzyme
MGMISVWGCHGIVLRCVKSVVSQCQHITTKTIDLIVDVDLLLEELQDVDIFHSDSVGWRYAPD